MLETLLTSEELAAWARTQKSGHLSTKRSELKRAVHYPPIAALVELSINDKALSSFDIGLSAGFRRSRAASTRTIGSPAPSPDGSPARGPNLQQIPRDPRFRALFVPAPGNVLVGADFNLMEMRAAAHISAEPEMTAAFERGDDLHRLVASEMLNKPPDEVTKEERKAAKAVNFGAHLRPGSARPGGLGMGSSSRSS